MWESSCLAAETCCPQWQGEVPRQRSAVTSAAGHFLQALLWPGAAAWRGTAQGLDAAAGGRGGGGETGVAMARGACGGPLRRSVNAVPFSFQRPSDGGGLLTVVMATSSYNNNMMPMHPSGLAGLLFLVVCACCWFSAGTG